MFINSMSSQSYPAKQHYLGENVFGFAAKFCKIAFKNYIYYIKTKHKHHRFVRLIFVSYLPREKNFPRWFIYWIISPDSKMLFLQKICPALWLSPLPPSLSFLKHFRILILGPQSIATPLSHCLPGPGSIL